MKKKLHHILIVILLSTFMLELSSRTLAFINKTEMEYVDIYENESESDQCEQDFDDLKIYFHIDVVLSSKENREISNYEDPFDHQKTLMDLYCHNHIETPPEVI